MVIARLSGNVIEKTPTSVIVDVNGVGYLVGVSAYTSGKLPQAGKQVELFIHHHITEATQQLYGFAAKDEQHMFENLITVKGVGPKVALGILSGMEPGELRNTVASGQHSILATVPGIGKKTAERIIVELQDKLGTEIETSVLTGADELQNEAVDALVALGYPSNKAQKAVRSVIKNNSADTNSSEVVKSALKIL